MTTLYRAYAVTINSALPLPELHHGQPPADVSVRFGPVMSHLEDAVEVGARFEAAPGRYLFRLEGLGRYLVRDGSEVLLDPEPEADEEGLRLHLLTSAMGAVAHQRGMLALHAGALEVGDRSVVIAGRSGAGKSTLVAALVERGYRVLSDDISVIGLGSGGEALVHPGAAHMKLWHDALVRMGADPALHRRLRPDLAKYSVPLGEAYCAVPLPLARVYVFAELNAPRVALRTVAGAEAFRAVRDGTFRPRCMRGVGASASHFALATAVCRQTAVIRVARPWGAERLDELVDALERDWSGGDARSIVDKPRPHALSSRSPENDR